MLLLGDEATVALLTVLFCADRLLLPTPQPADCVPTLTCGGLLDGARKAVTATAQKTFPRKFIGPTVAPLGHPQNPRHTPGSQGLIEQSPTLNVHRRKQPSGDAGAEFTELRQQPLSRPALRSPQT